MEWEAALYGPDGFYRRPEGPAGHFSTATHGAPGAVLGAALARLARDHGLTRVVDVGAGRGELLTHVANADPGLALLGVDVVARPEGLAAQADWLLSPGGASLPRGLTGLADTLVVAHEWLDVVPCTIARRPELGRADREWADHWWPDDATEDDVVEVGRARDEAWADLLSRLDHGVAVAIDYGHTRASRPPAPTFTAFRDGIEVEPALDGTTDLTAHVAMDSLRHDELLTQREALLRARRERRPPGPRPRDARPGHLRPGPRTGECGGPAGPTRRLRGVPLGGGPDRHR